MLCAPAAARCSMSGLTAAHTLLKADPTLRVVILEARDRIGGRMWSVETDWRDSHNNRWGSRGACCSWGKQPRHLARSRTLLCRRSRELRAACSLEKWACCCSITVDLGANWIEGVEGNPLLTLVNATHATLFPTPLDGTTQYIYDGHNITAEVRLDTY